jgi:hypothetical protein
MKSPPPDPEPKKPRWLSLDLFACSAFLSATSISSTSD